MKIPIHHLLDQLGIKDLVIDNEEDLAKMKARLDELIQQSRTTNLGEEADSEMQEDFLNWQKEESK